MRFRTTLVVALLSICAAFAQISEDELRSKISAVRYAPLARQARIQGDVRLKLNAGVVALVSGHPLLAPIAVASAKSFGSIAGETDFNVTYHFVLATTFSVATPTTVRRGNAFERAILRMLGLKTEKVVVNHECHEGAAPANDVKVSEATIEIWIYGTTFCLQPNTSTLVAER